MPNDVDGNNIATVERFYQSERDRDLASWVTFWHEDGRQTFPTLGADAVVTGIAALTAVTREKFETRPPYAITTRIEGFTDPTKVFAALDLDFPGRNVVTIWCIFHFDSAGLVIEVEEIFDRGGQVEPQEA
jgi:hypothetical protein